MTDVTDRLGNVACCRERHNCVTVCPHVGDVVMISMPSTGRDRKANGRCDGVVLPDTLGPAGGRMLVRDGTRERRSQDRTFAGYPFLGQQEVPVGGVYPLTR